MRILMVTNLYLPLVGGVPRSVDRFTREYRRMGHEVLVIAPECDDGPEDEEGVVRVPAIQHFNGTDFPAVVPIPGYLSETLESFQPEIVHSHHPFLLGSTAVRTATQWGIPLVYTFHTMYEHYTHYVPWKARRLREFVISLSKGYCDLCDLVFAPSESVLEILKRRGVEAPVRVVPTGLYLKEFHGGDGKAFRQQMGIPPESPLVGHVGRLAREKNLGFLAESVVHLMSAKSDVWFLLVGEGNMAGEVEETLRRRGLDNRCRRAGNLHGRELAAAYATIDVFAFASTSETQGMVLTEAAAAGTMLVTLDAPGAREVVRDEVNGRLVKEQSIEDFSNAVAWCIERPQEQRARLRDAARKTAEDFSMDRCARKALASYEEVRQRTRGDKARQHGAWRRTLEQIKAEWELLSNTASSVMHAVQPDDEDADRSR